jgi:hypothetical protein
MRASLILFAVAAGAFAAGQPAVTFHRDVLRILQENCQGCHRPGEIGPMPLRTYAEVRPWAKAIKQAVSTRKMPPWFADRSIGKFGNDPSLTQEQIDKLSAWADNGAPEGDAKDAPPARTFAEGWNLGTPDVVFEMPRPYDVPASGTIEYTYVIVPTGFEQDRWITGAEFRPGNRAVMHHATVFVRPPGSNWLRRYPVGQPFVPQEQIRTAATPRPAATTNAGAGLLEQAIAGYVPGLPARVLPQGYGMLIPAGSDLVFQLHYTTNGKTATDRSRVGFVTSKNPPAKRVLRVGALDDGFVIPPGASTHPVSGSAVLGMDTELISLSPHMHLRGKSMTQMLIYPTGEREELLRVPRYDFNWQLSYAMSQPKLLPKGTVMRAEATFDNSTNNRFNPDPKAEVRWGDQSWEEMMVGFFILAVPADADLRALVVRR